MAVRVDRPQLAEEGSRKDEVARLTADTPATGGRFTFGSLVWLIDGREAVTFLKSIANKIEDPHRMLLQI